MSEGIETKNEDAWRQRVMELEAELETLKSSTKKALDESWKQMDRLETENATIREQLSRALDQLNKEQQQQQQRRGSVGSIRLNEFSIRGHGVRDFLGDAVSVITADTPPSLQESKTWSMSSTLESIGLMSLSSSSSSSSNPPSAVARNPATENKNGSQTTPSLLSAWVAHQPSKVEKDLMRQLDVIQTEKQRVVEELEIKLHQRETAIQTLERAMIVKDETLQRVRDEMDDLMLRYHDNRKRGTSGDKQQRRRRSTEGTIRTMSFNMHASSDDAGTISTAASSSASEASGGSRAPSRSRSRRIRTLSPKQTKSLRKTSIQ